MVYVVPLSSPIVCGTKAGNYVDREAHQGWEESVLEKMSDARPYDDGEEKFASFEMISSWDMKMWKKSEKRSEIDLLYLLYLL